MITDEKAKQLLDNDSISQDVFDKITSLNKRDAAQNLTPVDPTQALRNDVGAAIDTVIPSNSPLAMSGTPTPTYESPATPFADQAMGAAPVPTPFDPTLAQFSGQAPMPAVPTVPASELEIAAQPTMPAEPMTPPSPQLAQAEQIGAQAAQREIGIVKGFEKELGKLEADNAIETDAKQQKLEADVAEAQKGLDEISAGKLQPGKVFADMNIFGKLAMVAAGTFAGPKVLDDIIERDLRAQEKLLDSKLGAAKGKVSRYQDILDKYNGNKEAARNARRAEMFQMAQLKLSEMAQQSRDGQAKQELALKAQELGMKAQENVQKVAEALQSQQGLDPITAKIMKFPAGTQAALLKAKETYDSGQATLKAINNTFASTGKIGLGAVVPFSDSKTIIATENAKLESAIRQTMAGQGTIQEAEIERNVKPFLLSSSDTDSMRKLKQQKLKEFIAIKMAGETKKLEGFGLLPQQPELQSLKKN